MATLRERNSLTRYRKERQRNLLARPGTHAFVVILDQLKAGFNVAKIFRSAEAFGAAALHLVAIGPFDPAPAKGSLRKVPAVFHEEFAPCYAALKNEGYAFFRLAADAQENLYDVDLPEKSAFIFGHEEFGCRLAKADYPDIADLRIPQFGSVQSLNVSIASTVVMYEYVRQRQRPAGAGGAATR